MFLYLGYLTIFDHMPTARIFLQEALDLAVTAGDASRSVAVRWLYAFTCLAGGAPDEAAAQVAAGWAVHRAH